MSDPRKRRNLEFAALAALLATTAAVFLPISGFEFINYDDPGLLLRNQRVNTGLSLANVAWAFTSTDLLQWAPLTWLTHMLDFQLFGDHPSGHHVTSLLFHLFNTLALFAFLRGTTKELWRSVFVAALFAVHPLHVEPVAWVSARKDLVSTAFLLLALIAYGAYARRPRRATYLVTLVIYAASLMSKPMYVTFPVMLLLLDHWPLARLGRLDAVPGSSERPSLGRLALEKVPFLCLAAASSAVAYFTQAKADAVVSFDPARLGSRVARVLVGYATYAWKTVWPAELAIVYPRRDVALAEILVAILLLGAVTAVALRGARTRPYLLVGWLWFLVTLLPVAGIVEIGSAWMSDKYTYVPIVGLFVMVAWGVPDLLAGFGSPPWRRASLTAATGVVLATCVARSSAYLANWRDSITLYTNALEVTERNFIVLGNLANAHQEQGRLDDALRYFHEAIFVEPRYDHAYASIGIIWLYGRGDCARAIPYLAAAVRLRPSNGQAASALAYCQRR